MPSKSFNPQDWVYVADPMGRLGQGFYKNIHNSDETLSISAFEAKRTSPPPTPQKKDEQKVNIEPSEVSQGSNTLSPWNNPVFGEEKATIASSDPPKEVAAPPLKEKSVDPKEVATQRAEEERIKHEEDEKKSLQRRQEDKGRTGDGNEGGSASKVICTALVERGMMSPAKRRACLIYAQTRLSAFFMPGYHFWAVPYVSLMNRSSWAVGLIRPFVRHRTHEVCYRLGLAPKGSWLGKLICCTHDPFCILLGRCLAFYDRQVIKARP